MLLRSERVRFESSSPPSTITEALRAVGREWRESALSPRARAAGVLGWKVRVDGDRVTVRARISGRNAFLPFFTGTVVPTAAGSLILGKLRLNWFARGFMLVWLTAVAAAPLLALLQPIPEAGVGAHIAAASFMLVPGIALFAGGRWLVQHGSAAPAAAIKEALACTPGTYAAPLDSDRVAPGV